eukprot:s107_g20.t1
MTEKESLGSVRIAPPGDFLEFCDKNLRGLRAFLRLLISGDSDAVLYDLSDLVLSKLYGHCGLCIRSHGMDEVMRKSMANSVSPHSLLLNENPPHITAYFIDAWLEFQYAFSYLDDRQQHQGLTCSKQHPGFVKLRLTSRPCLRWPRIPKEGLSLFML